MKPNYFDISDVDIKNIIIGGSGAGIMYGIKRFFNGRDALIERVRVLENQHARMEAQLSQINQNLKLIDDDINNIREYNRNAHHETRTLLTERNIKDDIVDKVYKSLEAIEKRLSDEKKW